MSRWPPLPTNRLQRALVVRLRAIPAGKLAATARRIVRAQGGKDTDADFEQRTEAEKRQIQRLRAGDNTDVKLSTLADIARALGESPLEILAPAARRPAPIGRRAGKPRGVRRQQDVRPIPPEEQMPMEWTAHEEY